MKGGEAMAARVLRRRVEDLEVRIRGLEEQLELVRVERDEAVALAGLEPMPASEVARIRDQVMRAEALDGAVIEAARALSSFDPAGQEITSACEDREALVAGVINAVRARDAG